MHGNVCWACKDSRTICNLARPRCSRCAKSKKPCQYGMRLSWPKKTNTKRSLTHMHSREQAVIGDTNRSSQTSFVNATFWDIQLHEYLCMHQGLTTHKGFASRKLDPPLALSWLPVDLGCEERGLLDHFISIASSTLAAFSPDKNAFLSLLIRLALSDVSPSSTAVLQSALALSSFHRHSLKADVFRFKARAMHAMVTSSNDCVESPTAAQHIAASMILCHLEMLVIPSEKFVWFCHLTEATRLVDTTGPDRLNLQSELSSLLDWVEYHIVMSRFSHRHWYKGVTPCENIKNSTPVKQGTCHSRKVKSVPSCSHEILLLYHFMFEMLRVPTDPMYHSDEYESSLRCLENRIINVIPLTPDSTLHTVCSLSTAWVATVELFKLAALIYLKRASRNFSGTSPQIDAMVERACSVFDDVEAHSAFPLLVMGCEARTDEQRFKILKHIEGVMKTNPRSLPGLQNILEQIWVQDDLAVDYELDYLARLDAVISSYRIMPSFV